MYKNAVKEMLRNHQPVLGCIVNGPFPALVEIIGLAGFHFVFIDAEHSSLSIGECEELVRAAELRHLVPIIRTPENNPKLILRYMDIGAMGLIVPEVNSRAEAEAAVRAMKYAPLGERGLATTRCSDFGYGKAKAEYFEESNRETMLIALIESKEGVEHAEEILSVDGVDACFVGTSDLSMSLGVHGQTNHPLVQAGLDKVLAIANQLGKPVGLVVREGEAPKKILERGVSMIFTNLHSLIRSGARDFIAKAAGE